MNIACVEQTETQASPEARLWMAVLARTLEEWTSGPLRRRRIAEQYLFSDERDFRIVCESAGVNPDRLRARLREIKCRNGELSATMN